MKIEPTDLETGNNFAVLKRYNLIVRSMEHSR